MSPHIKEAIQILYRVITFLAKVPIARLLIISNKYEYNYQFLAPLAMTDIPSSLIIPNLPKLPKEDELPSPKWLALVINAITVSLLTEANKSTELTNKSVANENKINFLESVNEEMKTATAARDLNDAVDHLLLTLESADIDNEQEVIPQNQREHHQKGNFEEELNKIDRELDDWINKHSQEKSAISTDNPVDSLTANELEEQININKTYTSLKKVLRYDIKLLEQELIKQEPHFRSLVKTPTPNPTLPDYENLIAPLKIKPATLSNFQQDNIFAYMQVAGPNPVMLNQIKELDYRLPITPQQYQKILPQDSLKQALEEGRVYIADYYKLDQLINGNFGGLQKYVYAPVALFAVPPENYPDRNLLPIAIRCQQTPGDDNPIFTPLDADNWMTAKTVLQMADSNYHELISHLAQTHLFIEPFVLATNRCFTDQNHPIRLLLKPHLEGTILINYGAHKSLLAPKGSIDSLLSGTIGSNSQLAIKEALSHLANFNEVAFPRTLEKRGVNNSQHLPIYPYRDDGQKIWDAIHQWVKEYLGLFYSSNQSVETDQQLKKWAEELFSKGNCHIGEQGDGRIKTLNYLVEAISIVIFTASAQHAAVNFPQSGLMSYAPAFPLGCYSPAPTQTQQQQNFMGLLPNVERAELQIQILYLLGSVYYTELGDYSGSHFQGTKVKIAWDAFKAKLTEIENKIIQEDSQRLVSYRYLLPSKIPQSINI